MIKALAMLSGGLDSTLAVKLVLDEGVKLEAVNFLTVFCTCTSHSSCRLEAKKVAEEFDIPLKIFNVTREYIDLIKHPEHGYGSQMNPCIDCRIFMLKKAKEYMEESGASFIITGEVLGERPMSQRREAMQLIERKAGLEGLIFRPLSAKLFEPTIPEQKGWVEREKYLAIQGRSRKPQIALAKQLNILDYPCPAGGCLLTDPGFARRLRELFKYKQTTLNDIHLLKLGRHFRLSPEAKLIVSRNESENNKLTALTHEEDICLQVADFPGPLAIIRGKVSEKELQLSGAITARYGKGKHEKSIKVDYWKVPEEKTQSFNVSPASEEQMKPLRV